MTQRCVCVLIPWLFFAHVSAALAGTWSQQQHVRQHSLTLCQDSAVALATASRAINTSTSDERLSAAATIQQDTTAQYRNIAESKITQRAWMYSAILPGWGQVYNKQYWKVPVLYLGFVGLGWGAMYYDGEYATFKQRLIQGKQGNSLKSYVDECRQGRDLCIIFVSLWYVINIFDAYVGASLKTFTLSEDIAMQVQPNVFTAIPKEPHVGFSLTLRLVG